MREEYLVSQQQGLSFQDEDEDEDDLMGYGQMPFLPIGEMETLSPK